LNQAKSFDSHGPRPRHEFLRRPLHDKDPRAAQAPQVTDLKRDRPGSARVGRYRHGRVGKFAQRGVHRFGAIRKFPATSAAGFRRSNQAIAPGEVELGPGSGA